MDYDWVIVGNYSNAIAGITAKQPSIFNFYPTREEAEAKVEQHRAGFEMVGEIQKPFKLPYVDGTIQVMTYDDFSRLNDQAMLSEPLREITEEDYTNALEALPPLKWEMADGVDRFMLGEAFSGTFYNQYARKDGRFFSRLVNAVDRSTWINATEIEAFLAETSAQPRMG